MRKFLRPLLLAGILLAPPVAANAADDHPILELRQYKMVAGRRDDFVKLFDREFVETQEADGMRLIGQFRDHDRPDRFTWIREFPNMASRGKSLNAFYFGPVWAAHKAVANPMLDDNDNVLLLRPARVDSSFGPNAPRSTSPVAAGRGMVFAVIEYLWKDPNDGFSAFFLDRVAPMLRGAKLPVLGAYVPETAPNNFPRLPVRQGEKVFVWFTEARNAADFQRKTQRLYAGRDWASAIAPALSNYQERPAQILRLDPTPRSALQ